MEDLNITHIIDLSKEEPAYESDQLYTRLFGKGQHNIYQFSDEALLEINGKTRRREYKKALFTFHGIKMQKDASRYKTYLQTNSFPSISGYQWPRSLKSILREDATFPATKEMLMKRQGWKMVDVTKEKKNPY